MPLKCPNCLKKGLKFTKKHLECSFCGVILDTTTFLLTMGLSLKDAYEEVNYISQVSTSKEVQILQEAFNYLQEGIEQPHSQSYLRRRGVTIEAAKKEGLGVGRNGLETYLQDFFPLSEIRSCETVQELCSARTANRILFPITLNSHIVGFSARAIYESSQPKYLVSKASCIFQKSSLLLGLDTAKKAIVEENLAILTEGNFDYLRLRSLGYNNTLSSLGSSATLRQLYKIVLLTNNLLIIYDSDKAGEEGAQKVKTKAKQLGLQVYIARLPHLAKDVDEYLERYSPLSFKKRIDFYLKSPV